MGFFDLDLPCDIRDIIADVRNLAQADEIKWDMIAMLALDAIGLVPMIGALKYSDEYVTLFKNADKVSVVARSTDGAGVLAKHADEAGAWLHGGKVFRYSDETAEAVASGEKLLKESQTVYESFADMMSPEDAKRYLDFLENGSREGLTSAELAGVEKADALRHKLGVPETDTIAVGKTDVKGMEGVTFEGQSPKVRSEAGLPDLDEIWAERNIKSPGNNPLFTRHAEEALANDNVSPGVLKQLSLKYPNLRIEVTSEILPDVKVIGKSNFVIQNGQYVE